MYQSDNKDTFNKINKTLTDIEDNSNDSLFRLKNDNERILGIGEKLDSIDTELDNGNRSISNISWNNCYTKLILTACIGISTIIFILVLYFFIRSYIK